MTHIYNVSGMTCTGCQEKVQKLLTHIEGVKNVSVDLAKGEVAMDTMNPISTARLRAALKDYPKYKLEEVQVSGKNPTWPEAETKSWLSTYKPLLLVFAYITGITLLPVLVKGNFNWETWMQNFMAGFFLTFSFFKLLDLKGFADTYATYDIIAKKWKGWGYVYAFIELGLGVAYLLRFRPVITNIGTFLIMTVSVLGVLQSVLNKKRIPCACLGAIFNLPMSTVTIFEDGLMIVMSLITFISLV